MPFTLTDDLRPTDLACDRWAYERRDNPPTVKCTLHNMALTRAGIVLDGPLEMSEISMLVDRIYLESDAERQSLLVTWYCDPAPVIRKAKKIGISSRTLYRRWESVLRHVRDRLLGFGAKL